MIELKELADPELWEEYYSDFSGKNKHSSGKTDELKEFIQNKAYTEVVNNLLAGTALSVPEKHLISKSNSTKKRAVYTYSTEEMYVLKILAHRLHEYDGIFSPQLYSFRCHQNAKTAFDFFRRLGINGTYYSYKVDISNYFNSIPVEPMLQMLNEHLNNPELCKFFKSMLEDKRVIWQGNIISENKGIMAGTPTASFLANMYLTDVDCEFEGTPYARYSDDIILFAKTADECERMAQRLKKLLADKGLEINKEKEIFTNPNEPWTFLGITVSGDTADISPVSLDKLKAKLRRRARSIERWKRKKGATGEQAARAFIRAVNRKLYDNPNSTELTWCRWYFPLINTDKSLHELDEYIQLCIRYVVYGNYGKKTYGLTYQQIKQLGFRSLVHEYYL